jgi:hypothetical protein
MSVCERTPLYGSEDFGTAMNGRYVKARIVKVLIA